MKRMRPGEHAFAVRLMQHLVVPTFVLDPDRRVLIWNMACERLTGVAAEELIGTTDHWRAFYDSPRYCLADVVASGRTEDLATLYPSHSVFADTSLGLRAENWCVMPRSHNRLYLAIDSGPIYDDDGRLIAVVETLRDQTEQKLAQMALESLAVKDGLTGVANRRCFDESIEAEWLHARREHAYISLLIGDVDFFKPYNDTYGHQQGDDCLRAVAAAIDSQAYRPKDVAARYGGEEFAVIMPSTDPGGAQQVAERVRAAVYNLDIPHSGNKPWQRVTVSIGVASMIPSIHDNQADLIGSADKALYAAKHGGRNRVISAELDL